MSMPPPNATLRIKSIKVSGLFGLYDHHVTLNEERVTVIHGPNGVGKTVFLKLTNAFMRGRYVEMARVPFRSMEVLFGDDSLAIVETEGDSVPWKRMRLSLISVNGEKQSSIVEGEVLNSQKIVRQIVEAHPFISQVGPEEWVDRRTEEVFGFEELSLRIEEYSPQESKRLKVSEPKGLKDLRSRINVHLIEAQRLIRLTNYSSDWRYRPAQERTMTNTVQEYSRDLKKKLESALASYAKQSQKLDQTFPQRLIHQGIAGPLSIEMIKKEMQEVESIRDQLKRIGILDGGDSSQDPYPLQISQLDDLQQSQLSVMAVYAKDTKEKLSVLTELSGRIEILLDVLSRKFTNKRVKISRESGLVVVGTNEKPIPITSLSSGEQHELVLLYDLLFKVKPNTLVLIDEPELSLHISWQKGFMEDLLGIIRLAHFDVLMATHSPYIVGDRSDLLVVLSPDRETESAR